MNGGPTMLEIIMATPHMKAALPADGKAAAVGR